MNKIKILNSKVWHVAYNCKDDKKLMFCILILLFIIIGFIDKCKTLFHSTYLPLAHLGA